MRIWFYALSSRVRACSNANCWEHPFRHTDNATHKITRRINKRTDNTTPIRTTATTTMLAMWRTAAECFERRDVHATRASRTEHGCPCVCVWCARVSAYFDLRDLKRARWHCTRDAVANSRTRDMRTYATCAQLTHTHFTVERRRQQGSECALMRRHMSSHAAEHMLVLILYDT